MKLSRALIGTIITLAAVSSAIAQNQGGAPPGGGAGGPGGGFDPAQMREQMMLRMKERLNASDDQWKTVEPRLQKVMDAQRAALTRGMGGFGRGGRGGGPGGPGGGGFGGGGGGFGAGGGGGGVAAGGGQGGNAGDPNNPNGRRGRRGGRNGGPGGPGGDPNQPPTETQLKLQELTLAVDDPNTTPEQLKDKIKALRDARAKAKADLTTAQNDLAQVVTQKQQATLITMGFLE